MTWKLLFMLPAEELYGKKFAFKVFWADHLITAYPKSAQIKVCLEFNQQLINYEILFLKIIQTKLSLFLTAIM